MDKIVNLTSLLKKATGWETEGDRNYFERIIELASFEGGLNDKMFEEYVVNTIALKQQDVAEDLKKTNVGDEQWWYLRGFQKGLQWLEDQLNIKLEGQ